MPVRVQVETVGLVEELVRLKAFHRHAHRAATLVMTTDLVKRIDHHFAQHHDTNRYINGYISAAIEAGAEGLVLKPYRQSVRHQEYLEMLGEQVDQMRAVVKRLTDRREFFLRIDSAKGYKRDGTPKARNADAPFFRKLERDIRKANKRLDRAIEELSKAMLNESVLFIHGRKARLLRSGRLGASRLATVRDTIAGGRGSIELIGDRVFVTLENLEAHSRIIESKPGFGHPYRTAINELGAFGLRRAGRKYIETQASLFGRRPVSAASIRAANTERHVLAFVT